MSKPHPKRLLVEGAKDRRVIPFLMEANSIFWPDHARPVEIAELGGNQLKDDDDEYGVGLSVHLKAPGLKTLGIVLDADKDAAATWRRVANRLRSSFDDVPVEPPVAGFVSALNVTGQRCGVWLMPDNSSAGMLETFLLSLISTTDSDLLVYATDCVDAAKMKGASYKDVHRDKARIHTWLAWQDEPGAQLHEAVDRSILEPTSPYAQKFVSWFRTLFEI